VKNQLRSVLVIVVVSACSNEPDTTPGQPVGTGVRAGMGGQMTTPPSPGIDVGVPVPGVNNEGGAVMPPSPSMPLMPPSVMPPPTAPPPPPLILSGSGSSALEPAEVCRPEGANARLAQLTCEGGAVPTVQRRRNAGPRNDPPDDLPADIWERMRDPNEPLETDEVDYHVVDRFELDCDGELRAYYVDVYHCG
jgi:hypothetical protein